MYIYFYNKTSLHSDGTEELTSVVEADKQRREGSKGGYKSLWDQAIRPYKQATFPCLS
jgi:hypothetical protein